MTGQRATAETGFRIFPHDGLQAARLVRLFWHFVWRIALMGLLGWGSYLFVSHYVVQVVSVDGVSMYPTLRNADTLFLNRWFYYYRQPRPGDIVVIKDPSDQGFAVKRIIAGPDDFVCVYHGQVYVNGRKLNEPYLPAKTWTFPATRSSAEWMIGCRKGEYIVLGDNRGNSLDSRYYGVVKRDGILGIVFL